MKLDVVTERLRGIPNMTPEQGAMLYRHLVDNRAHDILELGTAHAVSACYAAAALEELGSGRVVTVDSADATQHRVPEPEQVISDCGLGGYVERVLVRDSSYTWWLKDKVAERSDSSGNCEPMFDFCYLDGAHNWTIDGLSVILIEKLLRPGGWLLLDDLNWKYDPSKSSFGPGQSPADLGLSDAECAEPHMKAVFDLLVQQHPSFTIFHEQGGEWGWAQKNPDAPRTYTVKRNFGSRLRLKSLLAGSS